MEDKILKISVAGHSVGMVGLEEFFLQAKEKRRLSEVEIEKFLLEEAKKKNFIAARAEGEYAKALLREFKKFMGEKVEEEKDGFLEVAILGPGCYSCNKLEQDILAVLSETGIKAGLSHITDPSMMVQYGILSTPALVINGKVKCAGRLPSKSMIKNWLEEERG